MDSKSEIPEMCEFLKLLKELPNTATTFLKDPSLPNINRGTMANIEIKIPFDESVKNKYDWKKAVQLLHE